MWDADSALREAIGACHRVYGCGPLELAALRRTIVECAPLVGEEWWRLKEARTLRDELITRFERRRQHAAKMEKRSLAHLSASQKRELVQTADATLRAAIKSQNLAVLDAAIAECGASPAAPRIPALCSCLPFAL
jgi:hypothetical protein